jgi:hypothetical protein
LATQGVRGNAIDKNSSFGLAGLEEHFHCRLATNAGFATQNQSVGSEHFGVDNFADEV